MTTTERLFLARVRRQLAAMSPEAARRYIEAYNAIRRLLSEAELVAAIRTGQIEALLAEVLDEDRPDPVFRRLRLTLDRMVLRAAEDQQKRMPTFLRAGVFDTLSPRVIDAARSFHSEVIHQLSREVEDVVRSAAVSGLERGQNPRAVAREIRDAVGLAPRQLQYVANFRAELESGNRVALHRVLGRETIRTESAGVIRRSGHASGRGLSKAQLAQLNAKLGREPLKREVIDAMVRAYTERLKALNVEAHTKTRMLQAYKIGQRASWEDAIERGIVERSQLRRTWWTTLDGRERPEHHELHGTQVGFDERYPNGQLIPGEDEYNCRCIERYSVAISAQREAA